jgi:hypothetical protein
VTVLSANMEKYYFSFAKCSLNVIQTNMHSCRSLEIIRTLYFLFSSESSCNTMIVPPPPPARKLGTYFSEVATESAHRFALSEIEDATDKFEKKIGSGGFGIVYYGKLTDGREIAVKVLTNETYQGIREFLNEVLLCNMQPPSFGSGIIIPGRA